MRKLLSVAGAMMIATSVFATPASAQSAMAGGSCGYQAGDFGLSNVDMDMFPGAGMTVPDLFFQVNYSGVPAPTTIGVIVRFNGELEEQRQVFSATADTSGGTLLGAIRVSTEPDTQGSGANGLNVTRAAAGPGSNSTVARDSDGVSDSSNAERRNGAYTSGQRGGGIEPGDYVFSVYTGSRGDVYNVKDGTVARNAFIADEKGFLGKFSCGVSQIGE
jgi:hypothetical protein